MPRKKRGMGRRGRGAAHRQAPTRQSVPESEAEVETQSDAEETPTTAENEAATPAPPEEIAVPNDAPESETSTPSSVDPPCTSAAEVDIEDEKSGTDPDYWSNLLGDKEYLVDASLGYAVHENLKQPLKSFTSDDELQLFPVIETMSAKLYNIVQKMNTAQKRDIENAIRSKKGVIKIPTNGVMKAYLCHVNSMEAPPEAGKTPGSKRAPHPFLLTEDEHVFTEEKITMLRAVLDSGWKREVVMRSPGSTGRKTGDVYYYSPDGTKFRSSKQVAQHLAELRDTPFTIENFSFAKVRISPNPDQEIVRKAYDGKTPPRSPSKATTPKPRPPPPVRAEASKPGPKPSSSREIVEMDSRTEEPIKGVSSRRSIQPPKRYSGDAVMLLSKRPKMQDDKHRNSNSNKGLMQMGMLPPKYPKGMEDTSSNLSDTLDYNDSGSNHGDGSNSMAVKEFAEDSLFQISALRQSGGIDVEKMHQYVENQKKLAMKAASGGRRVDEAQPGPRPIAGGSKRNQGTVICSIRCAGMLGVIPSLQCTRCLCLFHAECLGLPPNLCYNKYTCQNCTELGAASSAAGSSNHQKMLMKKPSDVKRAPPGLAPLPHGHNRGPVPGRDITVTIAGKEHVPVRLPSKVVNAPSGMGRGMMRPRGGAVGPQMRTPGQRMIHHQHEGAAMSMMRGNAQMMRRGRGRPPGMGVPISRPPPQINRNLTITQLPRFHGPPPVPNLQPMSTPKAIPSKLPLPHMAGSKPRQAIAVPNLMNSKAFRVAVPPPSLSGRTFKKVTPQVSQQTPTNLRLAHPPSIPQGAIVNRTPPEVYSTVHDRSIPLVKRSPQTVCVFGGKKFVVLPKNKKARDYVGGLAVGNGGIPKGNYPANDGMRTPESVSRRNNDDVSNMEQMLGYANNDNATTAKEIVGQKMGGMSANEATPSSEQMLSYNNNENSQTSEEQGNGNVDDDNSMEVEERTVTLTDVGVAASAE